jgi:phosphatidylserine/phosphatidylglycerophosphate/cardiolipin synthase-like enzyme
VSVDHDIERVLDRLSVTQIESLAAAASGRATPDGSLAQSVVGAKPGAHAAVAALATTWKATPGLSGDGIALALRVGLRARNSAEAARSRPVWTGPEAPGEQRLTASVLHELVAGARRRVLLVSFAAHTLPSLAADLEAAVARSCVVDVVFETEADSAGGYSSHEARPFGDVPGICRWRWPIELRTHGAVLHAKTLIIDGERALVGSANLTKRALTANLELGVLIRDPTLASALEMHPDRLMERAILTRMDAT